MTKETVVNLKEKIQEYAALKTHTHLDYLKSSDLNNYLTTAHESKMANNNTPGHTKVLTSVDETSNDPVSSKGIVNYLSSYITDNSLITRLENYATKAYVEEKISDAISRISIDWGGHSITNPKSTTTLVDKLIQPGYYKYHDESKKPTIKCSPDVIAYSEALIKVEKQSNHLIQHLYATSITSNQKYKIDGRIFVRHGYTSTKNGVTTPYWEKWYVSHIPWRERPDLITSTSRNVNSGSFKIYECTPGYVFKWKQGGTDDQYTLEAKMYNYHNICNFKELPIINGFTVGNLIGHSDIRIMNNCFKIRSINKQGEIISGVDVSYFVPRTN